MNPVAENFSRNLRSCRKRAKLTQEGLAFDAGLHRTEIGLLETGARVPRIDTLVKLASALAIPPGELLDGIEWQPPSLQRGSFDLEPPEGDA